MLLTFLYEQLFRAIQLLFDDPKACAELQGLTEAWRESRTGAKESLDFRPQAGIQSQNKSQLESRHQVWIHGNLLHAVARLSLFHAEIDEGSPQATGLSVSQVKQLLAHLGDQLIGHEESGGTVGVELGFVQSDLDELHEVGTQELILRIV